MTPIDRATKLRARYEYLLVQRETWQSRLKELQTQLLDLRRNHELHTSATSILIQIGTLYRSISTARIEKLVTQALRAVFSRPYEFEVRFTDKRDQIEMELLIKDGPLVLDPMFSNGGGLIDVVSLALRIVLWSMMKDNKTDPILILDEPARMVFESNIPDLAELLSNLSSTMGIQFIIVTHNNKLACIADRTITVSQDQKGISHVEF